MCGIVGVYRVEPGGLGQVTTACALVNNRGHEAVGIAGYGTGTSDFFLQPSYVRDACASSCRPWTDFVEQTTEHRINQWLGHTRYKTVDAAGASLGQPLPGHNPRFGEFCLVHNGQLPDHAADRQVLSASYSFTSASDSETLVARIALSPAATLADAVAEIVRDVPGGYALIVMTEAEMVAATDRYWTRPLMVSIASDHICFASERAALPNSNGQIKPLPKGTLGIASRCGDRVIWKERPVVTDALRAHCIWEGFYFSRPDQPMNGHVAHEFRMSLGAALARAMPSANVDFWCGVPETGNESGLGLARALDENFYVQAIIKNWYVTQARAFMLPDQAAREAKVRQKYTISDLVRGQRVGVVDDSLVRSTTARVLTQMLFDAGAKEVHWRIAAAPIIGPCFTGIDIPTYEELAAAGLPPNDINSMVNGMIGATSLFYIPLEKMVEVANRFDLGWCTGCFSGQYPPGLVPNELIQLAHAH